MSNIKSSLNTVRNQKEREDPYFDKEKYKENKNKPKLIAFGKGNGRLTISNTKNSGPKGPIKRIIHELSKICLVILTDEFRTSQICNLCNTDKVEYIKVVEKPKQRDLINEQKIKELGLCAKTMRIILKSEKARKAEELIESIKVENLKEKMLSPNKSDMDESETVDVFSETKNKYEKELEKLKKSSHKLCHCKNENHSNKLWQRNFNSAKNIMNVMIKKVKGEDLGKFSRNYNLKNEDPNAEGNFLTNITLMH